MSAAGASADRALAFVWRALIWRSLWCALLALTTSSSSARADDLVLLLPFSDETRVAAGAMFPVGVVRKDASGALVPVERVEWKITDGAVAPQPSPDPFVATAHVQLPLAPGDVVVSVAGGATGASATVKSEPIVDDVVVSVEPAQLVKGQGVQKAIIRVLAAGQRAPEVAASVGTVSALVVEGTAPDGRVRWAATYTPGPARYPEVAVITAARPWPDDGSPAFALGHTVLPQSAAITLPGETRPKVQMTVEIAGQKFGPVPSDARGRFEIPIVVPPGIGTAQGISLDKLGNRRTTSIDLRLPPTNRIAATAWPRTLFADGESEAEIVVVVVDKTGAPASETPSVRAEHGTIAGSVRSLGGGRYRARYRAPARAVDDVVDVKLKDGSRALVPIEVRPGAPAQLDVQLRPELLPVPSDKHAVVVVGAADGRALPVSDALVDVRARLGSTSAVSLPRVMRNGAGAKAKPPSITYRPPAERTSWRDPLLVVARAADGEIPARVVFGVDETADAGSDDGGQGAPLVALVVDPWDRPVPEARVRLGKASVRADGRGVIPVDAAWLASGPVPVVVDGSALPLQRLFVGRDAQGRAHGWPTHPGLLAVRTQVELMEPVPVDVVIERISEQQVRWRVDGGAPGKRKVAVAAPGQPVQLVEGREGTVAVAAGMPVTVTDVESGVSSVLAP